MEYGKVFSFMKNIISILYSFPRKAYAQLNIRHSKICYFLIVNQTSQNHFPGHHIFRNQILEKSISMR